MSGNVQVSPSLDDLLPRQGFAAPLFRATAWSEHPLGDSALWPPCLRHALLLLFSSRQPMVLIWGEGLHCFYNDAFLPSLRRDRWSFAMGRCAGLVWGDVWPLLSTQIRATLQRGEASWEVNRMLPTYRSGQLQEAHWTYACSPIFQDDGRVGGALITCSESTPLILQSRRQETARSLAYALSRAPKSANLLTCAVEVFSTNPSDIPFTLAYKMESQKDGLPDSGALAAFSGLDYELRAEETGSSLWAEAGFVARVRQAALNQRSSFYLEDAREAFPREAGTTRRTPACVVPLVAEGQLRGFMVFGLSPRLSFDDQYDQFLIQLARHTSLNLEMRRSQRAIEAARQEMCEFFLQTPMPAYVVSGPEHVFTLANPAYLAYMNRDMIGRRVRDVFPELGEGPSVEQLDQVYRTGEPSIRKDLTLDYQDTDGKICRKYIDMSYHPFRDDRREITGVLAFVHDVTDRKLAREVLEHAVRARDEFLSIASHELKTPVTSLKMQLQMTQLKIDPEANLAPPPAKLAKVLHMSSRQVERISVLIDLMDLSRIESGKMQYEFAPLEICGVVREVAERFEAQFADENRKLKLHLADEAWCRGDRFRMEQVFNNLITNAIKYGGSEPIEITVSSDGGELRIEVRDYGPGIAKNKQALVFDRFERAETHQGISGLGLYIGRQIVQAHGGSIRLKSENGDGCSFIITLQELPRQQIPTFPLCQSS